MVKPSGQSDDKDTERRILVAAHEVFLRRGTAGARMQEIADEAGVNKALLHYYFRSKERLAQRVFEQAAREMFGAVFQLFGSAAPLETKVSGVIAAEMEFLMGHPYLPGYVLSELHHRPERITQIVAMVGTPPVDVLAAQIEEAVSAGTMRPIAVEEFVINLVSLVVFPFAGREMIHALLGMDREGFGGFLEERKSSLAGFFLGALRP